VFLGVLEHHLFLLEGFEATLPDIGCLLAQTAIGSGREVVASTLALAPCFY